MRHLWIKIDGSFYETPEGHDKWAYSKVLRLTGKKPETDPSEVWQKLTGDIKVTLDDNSVGYTIHRGVTRNQIQAMKALADGVTTLGYEIYGQEGPPSHQEIGPMPLEWDVFIGYLRKLHLLHESIETSPEERGRKLGLTYNGPIRKGEEVALYMFTDPMTKTTFSVRPQGDVELELKKSRRRFGINEQHEVTASYWIYPNGKIEKVDSHVDSAVLLTKVRIRALSTIYKAMEKYRLIRVARIFANDIVFGVESITKPTESQIRAVKELTNGADTITYERTIREGDKYKTILKTDDLNWFYTFGGSVKESLIDYPKDGLDPEIWEYEEGLYSIREEVRQKILNLLSWYTKLDLSNIEGAEYHITGSICTNQYQSDTDIDVHIVVPEGSELNNETEQKEVFVWYKRFRDEIDGYIREHPIEVYIQRNPAQEFLSDGVYDFMNREWLKGPTLVDFNFDPYEEYSDLIEDVVEEAEKADILLGELRRDVIDYDLIKNTIEKRIPVDIQKKLLSRLELRLKDIEEDIENLFRLRGEWTDVRRNYSQPTSIEQALKDVELSKNWRDRNAVFKFLARYNYLKLIGDLHIMIEDNSLTDQDVNVIKRMIGV